MAYNEGVSPVAVSLRKDLPAAGSREADIILGYDEPKPIGHDVREEEEKKET